MHHYHISQIADLDSAILRMEHPSKTAENKYSARGEKILCHPSFIHWGFIPFRKSARMFESSTAPIALNLTIFKMVLHAAEVRISSCLFWVPPWIVSSGIFARVGLSVGRIYRYYLSGDKHFGKPAPQKGSERTDRGTRWSFLGVTYRFV